MLESAAAVLSSSISKPTTAPPVGAATGRVAVTRMVVVPLFSSNADTVEPDSVRASRMPLSAMLIVAESEVDVPATVAEPLIFTVSAVVSASVSTRAVS